MEPSNFQRVNDTLYKSSLKDKKELFVDFKGKFSPDSYETAKKISAHLPGLAFSSKTRLLFRDHGKTYAVELHKPEKQSWIAWLFSSFFTSYQNPNKVLFDVTELSPDKPLDAIDLTGEKTETLKVKVPVNDPKAQAFSDGYTKLATQAFQQFEPLFKAHDIRGKAPNDDLSQYCIVQIGNKLELRDKDSVSDGGAACAQYLKFINKEYGEEKVKYIAHQYGISFDGPLTPEMVYRMNIGVGNVEIQDLKELQHKLSTGKENELSTHEQRLLLRKPPNFSHTNLNHIAGLYSLKPDELKSQYTGREIAYPIEGQYTLAHTDYFKPWVDQQELLQISGELKNAKNWDRYHELISFVVCKKHLARAHPTEDFRMGAIIPAPMGENRFYVVTSLVTNSQGILSYTLEPLDPADKNLPAIKSFLNTSATKYALAGTATIRNDLNLINSPGYEGSDLCKKYEVDFYKKRTIPLWVSYGVVQAKDAKNPKEALIQAVKSFEEYKIKEALPKSVGRIIRTHDAQLMQIAQNQLKESIFNIFTLGKLVYILLKYKNPKSIDSLQNDDAKFLLSLIDKDNPLTASLRNDLLDTLSPNPDKLKEIEQNQSHINHFTELLNKKNYNGLIAEFEKIARLEEEHPDQKLTQSLLFVGHSLGAACSQKAYADLCTSGRTTLTGTEMGVRGFMPPGINAEDNEKYKALSKHKELFKDQNIQHSIVYKIASGDVVSQGGQEQLGVAYTEDEREELLSWNRFDASVSTRTDTTTVPEIRESSMVHCIRFEAGEKAPTPYHQSLIDERNRTNKVAQKHFGDYQRTWVDPLVLKRFAYGEKHVWSNLQELWQVMGLRSETVERLRTVLAIAIRVILVTLDLNLADEDREDVGHDALLSKKDPMGVIAVDLSGVASQRT